MRACSIITVAVAGLALGAFGSHRAEAMTSTSPAGMRAAIAAVDVSEPVHCRRYVHKHRYGYSRGCGAGVVVIRRPGYVVREGVIIRDRRPSTSINIGIGSRPSGSTSGSTTIGTSTGSSPAPAATSAPAPAASGKATGSATTGTSAPAAAAPVAPAPVASGKATGSATTGTSAPATAAPAAPATGSAPAEQKK